MIRRIVLLLILLLAAPAQADEGRKVALIVANGKYANAGVLDNPVNDARIVAESAKRAGFESVTLASDLSLADFQRALRDFRNRAAGAQVAMVYYAGHGIEGSGKNWLIPVDAALASDLDLAYEAIDLDRVMEAISGAKVRMVVLDACRNNPFGRSWRSGKRAVQRGLGGVEVDDVLVIYAAAPGQTASDGSGGNSPFARSLAKRLQQPGLPIQLLGGAVRDDVLESTGGEQRPFVSASITGTPVYLVPGVAAAATTVAATPAPAVTDATLDALAWQGALGVGSQEAFEEYRHQFPKGRFVRLAEQSIAKLGSKPAPVAAPAPAPVQMATNTTDQRPPQGDLLVPESSQRLIRRAEIAGLSRAQLRIARNEIYARRGYIFQSADLRAHFSRFAWYRASSSSVQLSPIEQQNITLMLEEEKARGGGA